MANLRYNCCCRRAWFGRCGPSRTAVGRPCPTTCWLLEAVRPAILVPFFRSNGPADITNPEPPGSNPSSLRRAPLSARLPVPAQRATARGFRSINGIVYCPRARPRTSILAQMGKKPRLSLPDVLPFFKRMESYAGEGDVLSRSRGHAARQPNPNRAIRVSRRIIKAAAQGRQSGTTTDYKAPARQASAMIQATMPASPHEHGD